MKVFRAAKKRIVVSVGESVRIIRELQELSQNQLSALTGIPRATISAIENGRVNLGIERAKELARAQMPPCRARLPGLGGAARVGGVIWRRLVLSPAHCAPALRWQVGPCPKSSAQTATRSTNRHPNLPVIDSMYRIWSMERPSSKWCLNRSVVKYPKSRKRCRDRLHTSEALLPQRV